MNSLSKAEAKVMHSLCSGNLYKQIAEEKQISINTVKKHLKNSYRKLEARGRRDACEKFSRLQEAYSQQQETAAA